MKRRILAAALLLLSGAPGCWADERTAALLEAANGVYMMPEEVSDFSGETLELQDGRFRYWFYSDVRSGKPIEFPLTGTYEVRGDKVTLLNKDVYSPERTLATVQDQAVLWREDGLRYWQSERRIHPFAVLIRVAAPPVVDPWRGRPSSKRLYDEQMIARGKREYEERFNDQPEPVRTILRNRSAHGDPNLDAYRQSVLAARRDLDPVLIDQLVGLLGGKRGIEASMILREIYTREHVTDEEPSFLASPAERRHALENLIGAMAKASDLHVVDDCLVLFLAAAKVPKIVLTVPETGERIWIEGCSMRWESSPDDLLPRKSHSPEEKLRFKIVACQTWCRETLDRQAAVP